LERTVTRLPLPKLEFPVSPICLYGDDNLIVETQADTWVWIAALEEAPFFEIESLLRGAGVEWEGWLQP
jgi:hypothetical protein